MSTIVVRDRPSPARRLVPLLLLLLILGAIGVWAYYATRPRPATVETRDIVGLVPLDGEIVTPPSARADVGAPYRATVDKVHVSVGSNVNKGDVLVELAFPSVQAALDQATQNVKAAETAYANASLQYDRGIADARKQLDTARAAEQSGTQTPTTSSDDGTAPAVTDAGQASGARIAAEQALQQTQADRTAALSPYRQQLDAARDIYQQAKAGAKAARIVAPITGTVLAVNAQPGHEIAPDARAPVASIVDLSAIQVQAKVPADRSGQVKEGLPVALTFAEVPGKEFTGKVSRVTTRVDTRLGGLMKQQLYVAVIDFKNTDAVVKPGMKPQVALKTGEAKQAVAVPNDAVQRDNTGRPIVNALRNGAWQPVVVEVGVSDGHYTQIKSGLKSGETIQVKPDLVEAANLPIKK